MKNKVIGGTRPTDGSPLCLTCDYAMVVRGTRMGDDIISCQRLRARVTFHVTECSGHSDARVVPVYRLEETAWRMFNGRFVNPGDYHKLRKAAGQDDDD
jgi:hypothetical protein